MPISTALNACIPKTAPASFESSFSFHCTHDPSPGGQPKTCVSQNPPTVSFSFLAVRIFSIIALVFGYVIISVQLKFRKEGQFIDFLNQKSQGCNDFTFNKPIREILTQHKLKKQQ
jgi:hypothetical protein